MAVSARVQELVRLGDALFSRRNPIMTLWQTLAENLYPMRADFTRVRWMSEEFYSYVMTGRPILAHRELSNALSSILRPRGMQWFQLFTGDKRTDADRTAKMWFEWAAGTMRDAMYEDRTHFVRATKEGDADYVLIGQCVIEVRKNKLRDNVLCRTWHVRDCAWAESAEQQIDQFHLKRKVQARNLVREFPDSVSPALRKRAEKDGFFECDVREIVIPADEYDYVGPLTARDGDRPRNGRRHPFVRVCVDVEHNSVLYEAPQRWLGFVIPRWVTIGGIQYAYSPSALVALPDGRMLQQMTLTLLEIGQKIVDPPLLSSGEVIQGGHNLGAGEITYLDPEYDERTGEALRPLELHPEGLQWGVEWYDRIIGVLKEAFFLDTLNLPPAEGEKMTATEVSQRIKEYIRRAAPLFEPMDTEYNGKLCAAIFDEMMMMGRFGSWADIPQALRGADVKFKFANPLIEAEDEQKTTSFTKLSQLLASAMQIDPDVKADVNYDRAFRAAVPGTGAPAEWLQDEDTANAIKQQQAQAAAAAQAAQQMGQVADSGARVGNAAKNIGDAASSLQDAGIV